MILEIHEVSQELASFVMTTKNKELFKNVSHLTFDDGLYSQFKYRKSFYWLEIPMTFFISTSIICPEKYEQIDYLKCHEAHKMAFGDDQHYPWHKFSGYMKLSQIQQLLNEENEIGSHNHEHKHYTSFEDFKINFDTSIDLFKLWGIPISTYCPPYNQNFEIGNTYVKSKNIKIMKNRVKIEDFLKDIK